MLQSSPQVKNDTFSRHDNLHDVDHVADSTQTLSTHIMLKIVGGNQDSLLHVAVETGRKIVCKVYIFQKKNELLSLDKKLLVFSMVLSILL